LQSNRSFSVCPQKRSLTVVVIDLSRGGGGCEHSRISALQLHIAMHQLIIVILTCNILVHCACAFVVVVLSNRMMMRPPPQADLGAAAASPCSGATAALQALPEMIQDRLHLPITPLFNHMVITKDVVVISPPMFICVVLFRL
ncbi:MAG: hypothetical protein ACKPKO_09790, partial [Candidatus Fonsibacter sp.]